MGLLGNLVHEGMNIVGVKLGLRRTMPTGNICKPLKLESFTLIKGLSHCTTNVCDVSVRWHRL